MRHKSIAPAVALGVTLVGAALLRVWALGQGIPFAVGVDEPEVMERAVRMIKTGDFNPHFYDYPALYIYIQAAVASVRFLVGAMRGQWSALAQVSAADFYLWARAVTASVGTASVYLLYRAGLRWGTTVALLGAALFAVMPLHVRESHFVLTDVPTTFFVVLTLLLSLRAYEQPRLATFILAGTAAGLAAAAKYNGGLAVVMPVIACLGSRGARRPKAALMGAMLAAVFVVFLLTAPYTVLDLPTFLNAFARLSSDYRTPVARAEPVAITALKEIRNALDWRQSSILAAVPVGVGSLLAIGGVVLGLWRSLVARPVRTPWALATLFPLLYFWFVARQNLHFARYLLPLLPSVSLLTAAFIVRLAIRIWAMRIPPASRVAIVTAIVAAAIVPPLWMSIGFDMNASKTWTTAEAYSWIVETVPKGAAIRLEGRSLVLPAEYHPSYAKQLYGDSAAADAAKGIQYLVASSEQYGPSQRDPRNHPDEYAGYQRLWAETQEVARFTPSDAHPGPELRILKVTR